MIASRTTMQSASRVLRSSRPARFRNLRPQSTQSSSVTTSSGGGGGSSALIGGIAGGTVALAGCYSWYYFSGAKKLVNAAQETKSYVETAQRRLVENTPKPNEALKWLRKATSHYASFIPGASGYVDTAFDDFDKVHDKHRDEVDQIVKEAYDELKEVSGKELSLATAAQAWDVLQKHIKKIGELAGDAAEEILNNHPEIKKQVGGNIEELKRMGEQYGPEAKKQVDQTWDQIKDITKSGFSTDTADKIRKLVQEKIEMVKKLGDEAWKKGMEQAKPYLDKNPQAKKLIEENTSALKQGNFQQLYEKIKSAVESGNTGDLEKYVKDAAGKAKQGGGGGWDQLIKSIPGGDQVLPKLQSLQQVADKHGGEAKKLFEETVQEVTQLLSKKADKAQDIAKKAEQDTK